MEAGRKKLWFCLIVVALAAFIAGLIYYYGSEKSTDSFGGEGTLVYNHGDIVY